MALYLLVDSNFNTHHFYSDNDLIPKEELFFTITIVPFYTFSPNKMILQKDGGKKKQ